MNDPSYQTTQNTWQSDSGINTRFWFWLLCSLQLILWTLAPTLTRGNGPFDTIESLAWGNQWQLGYDKHPPLAAWLTSLITHLGGNVVGWPMYLLGQIAAIATFWGIWQLAKKIMPPLQALIAVALLQGIIYYTLITPKFNPTTLMSPIWALEIFVFYLALKQQKIWQWLLVGVFGGLAMLTKYQSSLLLFSMFLFMLTTKAGRKNFREKNIYFAIIIGILIMLPNVIWLFQHHFSAITYATTRVQSYKLHPLILNHIYYPIMFSLQQIGVVIPIFFMFTPFYFCKRNETKLLNFDKWFLLWMGLGPFFLTILISLIFGAYLEAKWATPYFILAGIILVAWYKPIVTKKHLHYFAWIVFIVMLIVVSVRSAFLLYGPMLTGKARPDAYFPGKNIAINLTNEWYQRYQKKLKYVAGAHYVVANIAVYSPDRPIPYFDWSKKAAAWVNENNLRKQGAVFVKQRGRKLPKEIKKRFPSAIQLPVHYYQKLTKEKVKPVAIGVALLPPGKN